MSDIAEAQRHWQRVRKLSQEAAHEPEAASLGMLACRKILTIGWRLGLTEAEERAVFSEGKQWIERAGQPEEDALLEWAYSICRTIMHGDLRGGLAHARAAQKLAEEAGNTDLAIIVSGAVIVALDMIGYLDEWRILSDRIIEQTRDRLDAGVKEWGGSHYIWALLTRGWVEYLAGDLEQARQMLEKSIELARARGELENEGFALSHFGELSWISLDLEHALAPCRRCVEIAERFGSILSRGVAYRALGLLLALNGRGDEAVRLLERTFNKQANQALDLGYETDYLQILAQAYLAAGDLIAARTAAEKGIEVGRRMGAMVAEAHSHLALARILLRQDGEKASAQIDEALNFADALYTKTGARNFKALVHLERAELARITGDHEAREHHLKAALQLFREMKAPIRVRQVEQLLADAKQGPGGST